MSSQDLSAIAQALVAEGKGILAADETVRTVTKRLAAAGIESTADSRRAYRQMFFTTPEIASFISGVILQDETIRQSSSFGTALVTVLAEQGILPGIKVDNGATPLAGSPGETITEGLDGLRERLEEYLEMGARFAKWRAVIHVSDVAVPAEARSRGGAGNRVSLRRAQSPRCDGASERHQSSRRTEAVEAQLLLWPGAAG